MSKKSTVEIEETQNVFDDHFLDIIGNEFKFDHVKGMAEWLKNSVDAYIDKGVVSENQNIVFRFTDQGVQKPMVECIDFVGMSSEHIDKAFKRWGDPLASKRGKKIVTYGGHGNGGKFYMRQMFDESRFITYKDGNLSIFGFSAAKKYGYAKGYNNTKMDPEDAFKLGGLDRLPIDKKVKEAILAGKTGFTIVQGEGPAGVRKKFKPHKEMERLKNHPQSYRILLQSNVSVVYNDSSLYGLLKPDKIKPLEKFEVPREISIPDQIEVGKGKEKKIIKLQSEEYPAGKLILKTSDQPMPRGGTLGELNRIDILGKIGVIGSYHLYELGVRGWPHAAFIYGECSVPILEDPHNDCVSNDRTKLVKNDMTDALLVWISDQIDSLASEIGAAERAKQMQNQKEITSKFNDVLNEWKNKHMKRIMSEIFSAGGPTDGGSEGGKIGTEVTLPKDGFSFKWPEIEIPPSTSIKAMLKVSVPETLPLGATIFVSVDNAEISTDADEYVIKSDFLKSTPDGDEVAFIEVLVSGDKVGAESVITATAGKHSDSVKVKVVEKDKDGKSGKSFPKVLLSGQDEDPLKIADGGSVFLTERDPIVYQRPQDVDESIYWINTSSPLASKIHDTFTFDSIQWRNFLFERYVDIFVKEAIHELERKQYESFSADTVDQKIADVVQKIHRNAQRDLEGFLFSESYVVKNEQE